MARPQNLRTKIFLDGGDPNETRTIIRILGFLDGQTTNPSLISKNPNAQALIARGQKFTQKEIFAFYKEVVKEISSITPRGSVSIEVYADKNTKLREMIKQAKEMFSWIPNAHIKFPINNEGLSAARMALKKGIRVNITLCFTQEQAAAVYSATMGAEPGDVFVSPFVGRLDDKGENGMDVVLNILRMYQGRDGHVFVLTSSVRNINHLLYALSLGSDIISAPYKILKEWAEMGMPVPKNFDYKRGDLKQIPYQILDLEKSWRKYNIQHELTDIGIEKFSADWNSLIM